MRRAKLDPSVDLSDRPPRFAWGGYEEYVNDLLETHGTWIDVPLSIRVDAAIASPYMNRFVGLLGRSIEHAVASDWNEAFDSLSFGLDVVFEDPVLENQVGLKSVLKQVTEVVFTGMEAEEVLGRGQLDEALFGRVFDLLPHTERSSGGSGHTSEPRIEEVVD